MDIKYYDRHSQKMSQEVVYGEKALSWGYDSFLGKSLLGLLAKKFVSRIYGIFQNLSWSKGKILPFIEKFQIDMGQFLPQDGHEKDDPYDTFNQFFIRRFKPEARKFTEDLSLMPAPCEARYFGYDCIEEDIPVPVKGKFMLPTSILSDERWAKEFKKGPMLLARLCPVDYHRFHFPDNGKKIDFYQIPGLLHSVNPLALHKKQDILCTNERHVTILETENLGLLAYVEVGAMMVGKIIQSHSQTVFNRGDEKGYFLFGGSTTMIFGQKGKWVPTEDILEYTKKGIETLVRLGEPVASRI